MEQRLGGLPAVPSAASGSAPDLNLGLGPYLAGLGERRLLSRLPRAETVWERAKPVRDTACALTERDVPR